MVRLGHGAKLLLFALLAQLHAKMMQLLSPRHHYSGYVMSERVATDLIIQALFRATDGKLPEKGLILHSVTANIAHMITRKY
jgi:hypothetical protein